MRMLDNVIDLNNIPVGQAQVTNRKYRAVGLGTFGWHHLLALKGIQWESEKSVEYADKIYEDIAYHTIQSSMELAKEKGLIVNFKVLSGKQVFILSEEAIRQNGGRNYRKRWLQLE